MCEGVEEVAAGGIAQEPFEFIAAVGGNMGIGMSGDHRLDKMGRHLSHAPAGTRRAKASFLTAERQYLKTYSRQAMKHSFITQKDHYGKAIRTFYTQDQASKKPLIALATYSDTTVSQATHRLAHLTRTILGRDFLLVADKEWYCGQLIQKLHAQYGVAVLTPVKASPKRQQEFDAVPL